MSSAPDQPIRRPKRDLEAAAAVLAIRANVIPVRPGTARPASLDASVRPPEVRAEWLERTDLVRHVSAVPAKLILLDAPAGAGKTVLVSQWRAAADGTRFAWVTLDPEDNNPSRLWWKVISALRRACPEFDADPPLLLMPRQGRILLTALLGRLGTLRGPVVLVLDDYHVISQHKCHTQVELLLRDLPRPVRVVLATRASPALRLARLRAAGEVADIGMRELRFGRSEVAALVSEVAGVQLADADLDGLLTRTEGWPAGVYLAALSLRGHRSPHTFIGEFTGDNRFIADFLAEEVLNRQPPDVREFLLRTSILDRFTAPLCDAVTGRPGAAELIARLDRENLFVVAADEHRVWYRYHHLFRQMLHGRLVRAEPGLVPVLHGRASAWHREAGSAGEAIAHALSAGDTAGVIGLVATHWYDLTEAGQAATVNDWIRSLGDARVAGDPIAAHCAAWVAALSGDIAAVRRWLPAIDAGGRDGPLPDGMRSFASSAALLRTTFGFDGLRAMAESGAVAAEMESDPASPWYAYARAALGFGLHLAGDPLAVPMLDQALAAEAARPLTRVVALSLASLRAADDDRLEQAREFAWEACTIVNGTGFTRLPPSFFVLTALGTVHARQGNLEEARAEFEYDMYRCRRWMLLSPWHGVEIRLRLAQVLLAMDDRPAAATVLAAARDVLTIWPDGAEALLGRLGSLERGLAVAPARQRPAEPLTEREQAVLRLFRTPLSVSEIARELYLSGNTVKTHRRAIYRKLGVSSREQAIERARQCGILR
ncbi:MAG TPA: LuxR C-terminal-related transcriptional regulator [Streptosporangiaceae bacterium]|nr:LuxR C-terminal-related transcriptional regulator [Streptosporangiaceae bacterium]